ncbi:hypothetical protein PG984_015030 [Apiospora sp. TS-2023a]
MLTVIDLEHWLPPKIDMTSFAAGALPAVPREVSQMVPKEWATRDVDKEDQSLPANTRTRCPRRQLGLPILFEGQQSGVPTIACADTGADSNIIAYDVAESLALPVSKTQDDFMEFELANGKIVKSIGTVLSRCDLAPGRPSMVAGFVCLFHVFETLAVPIIVGMPLLEATRTLSQFRDRLVKQIIPTGQSLQVNHVGSPRRRLLCCLDGKLATANIDSGSDADFLSAKFARDRGLRVEENQEIVMFADGSTEYTCGITHLPLAIEDIQARTLEFHVCASLTHDVIVGQDSIEDLEIFTHHRSSLITSADSNMIMRMEPIRLLEKLGNPRFSVLEAKVKKVFGQLSNASQTESSLSSAIPPSSTTDRVSIHGTFPCDYPGCQAAPFPTQYLLKFTLKRVLTTVR